MEKGTEQKHLCKFCNKSLPCGRSLGGHMRSHLITISPPKNDEKSPKKKLPPLPTTDQLANALRENPKKTNKFSKPSDEENTLLEEKACKECGKAFHSWKALFGHMKCHSRFKATSSLDENDQIMDSQSDNEAVTPLRRKKRSDRMKRYTPTTNSSSLTLADLSPDHHEQEEVALSLIILSRDKGDWDGLTSLLESSDNEAKTRKLDALNDEAQIEFEVSSPRNLFKKSDHNQFGRERKKSSSKKRKSLDADTASLSSKFMCSICKKAFPSYQALGGHRASHKKFKGCCAPRSENSLETENSHNQSEILNIAEKGRSISKKSRDHECPICFKVFPSGQALGGHKRSHLIIDQDKNKSTLSEADKPIRNFLDLNLPAPDEEECDEFKPWWIAAGCGRKPPLLGLMSS